MTNFNERMNTLLYKDISLTLYSRKGWCWLCVRGELETGTDCYILTPSSSDQSSTSFAFWLGLLNRGSVAGFHAGILSPTGSNCNWNWLKPSVAPGYKIVSRTPASAVPPFIYTGASLDWRLGRGSIYNIWFPQSWILHCLKMYKILYKSHKIYREERGNLKSGTDSRRKKPSRGEDPERHIPGRCTITITIWHSDDATQWHSQEMHSRIQTHLIAKKINQ